MDPEAWQAARRVAEALPDLTPQQARALARALAPLTPEGVRTVTEILCRWAESERLDDVEIILN